MTHRVLIFGSFDGLHDGHKSFLTQARALGGTVIVAIATDNVIRHFKKHDPKYPLQKRLDDLRASKLADEIYEADEQHESWEILARAKPDVIALGYDQEGIKKSLDKHFQNQSNSPTIVILKPYKPEVYKSSILNK